MAEIVDLAAARGERTPHLTGKAFCISCKHEHIAVIPTGDGVTFMECPACHRMTARFKFEVWKEKAHWECNCGNDLFRVTPEGYYCPSCGADAEGF